MDPALLSGLTPDTRILAKKVFSTFTLKRANWWGGFIIRNVQGTEIPSKHSTGRAFDIGIKNPLGDKIVNWLVENSLRYKVSRIIWNGREWDGEWRNYIHPSIKGNPNDIKYTTLQHRDHIHVEV